jgi:hypothetical protein
VQKDQTGVFTTSDIYGRIYSFCLSPGNYLVAKETTTKEDPQQRLELIPHGCFQNVMPYNFMDKFSHWWDSKENKVHFREKNFKNPTFPASPEFTLDLDDMILTENATVRRIISCTSQSCFLPIEILKRIECQQFIHIWQDKQGEGETELVRLGLKFRLEGHKIVSHDFTSTLAISFHVIKTCKHSLAFEISSFWKDQLFPYPSSLLINLSFHMPSSKTHPWIIIRRLRLT